MTNFDPLRTFSYVLPLQSLSAGQERNICPMQEPVPTLKQNQYPVAPSFQRSPQSSQEIYIENEHLQNEVFGLQMQVQQLQKSQGHYSYGNSSNMFCNSPRNAPSQLSTEYELLELLGSFSSEFSQQQFPVERPNWTPSLRKLL